jgi:hypothetical protein
MATETGNFAPLGRRAARLLQLFKHLIAGTGASLLRSTFADCIQLGHRVGCSSSSAAARFSRRCLSDDAPGMSRMFGARFSSQASATGIGLAPSLLATSDSTVDCSGVKPPNGKNGT